MNDGKLLLRIASCLTCVGRREERRPMGTANSDGQWKVDAFLIDVDAQDVQLKSRRALEINRCNTRALRLRSRVDMSFGLEFDYAWEKKVV